MFVTKLERSITLSETMFAHSGAVYCQLKYRSESKHNCYCIVHRRLNAKWLSLVDIRCPENYTQYCTVCQYTTLNSAAVYRLFKSLNNLANCYHLKTTLIAKDIIGKSNLHKLTEAAAAMCACVCVCVSNKCTYLSSKEKKWPATRVDQSRLFSSLAVTSLTLTQSSRSNPFFGGKFFFFENVFFSKRRQFFYYRKKNNKMAN